MVTCIRYKCIHVGLRLHAHEHVTSLQDGWTPLHDFAYNGAEGFQAVLDIYDWIVKLGAATDLLNVQDHVGVLEYLY